MYYYYSLLLLLLLIACNSSPQKSPQKTIIITTIDSLNKSSIQKVQLATTNIDSILGLHDTTWVDLELFNSKILLEMRYATTNNFMNLQIYDCPKCYLRLVVAKALLNAQEKLEQQQLGFKMFDCYRPQQAQYKLWKAKPDPRFVSPPSKGSMHSRGGALDLTIINLKTGQELEMGTEYDYFGVEAYWSYTGHSPQILDNRQLLLQTMNEFGFKTVTTEWWHFSYRRAWFKLSEMEWDCPSGIKN